MRSEPELSSGTTAPMTVGDAWREAVAGLQARLNPHTFRTYVQASRAVPTTKPDTLCLAYPSQFLVDMVKDHYRAQFEEELLGVSNRKIRVEFVLLGDGPADDASRPAPAIAREAAPEPRLPAIVIPPPRTSMGLGIDFSFDRFIVGASNEMAHAVCRALANEMRREDNPVLLTGQSGVGKSHLAHAAGKALAEADAKLRVLCVTSEQFTNDVVHAIYKKETPALRRRYRGCDVLIVDDVHKLAGRKATEEEFRNTLIHLVQQGKQVILTSEKPPAELEGKMEESLRTRLEAGLVIPMDPPELETRRGILRQRAETHRLGLSEDVLTYLATNVRPQPRTLEGAVKYLASYSRAFGRPVTVELCETKLRDMLRRGGMQLDIPGLIEACAAHFDVKPELIKSQVRTKQVALARQTAMCLAREQLGLSYPAIADAFGGFDHSSVINAVKRTHQRLEEDPSFRVSMRKLVDLTTRPSL